MKVDVKLPKSWNQVTGQQMVKLASLFLKYQKKPDFLIQCFLLFSGWKVEYLKGFSENGKHYYWFSKKGINRFAVDTEVFRTLVNSLNWITEGFGLPASMPEIKDYQTCNVKLYNVTLDEFLNADNYYNAFAQTGTPGYLNRLVAVFYRRKGEKWDPELMEKRWNRFMQEPYEARYAVFMWFSGVKSFLVSKYPYIFSGNSSGNISPDETILNLLSSLNNGDVTHNQQIFKTHVHECFHELNLKAELLERRKK